MVTVPVAIVLFAVATVLLPVLVVLALIVDTVRWVRHRIPFAAIRLTAVGWAYLAIEMFGLAVLLVIWLVTGFGAARPLSLKLTYRLQAWWAAALFGSLRAVFAMELHVEGDEVVVPGPIVVMMRHASMADTLMPNALITRRHGILLRYVLKRELLIDPAIDIAGNRLVNHFVDRRSTDGGTEVMQVHALTEGLHTDEGVIIYPEGTRFSSSRRQRIIDRLESRSDGMADRAGRLRHVLPPRLGGSLAVLDASTDVVFVAHVGLDGLARVKDLWGGGLVGTVVEVALWRVPQLEIPEGRSERIDWLFEQWGRVDDWIEDRVR